MSLTQYKIARLESGIKQYRLARHLQMSESKLSRIETGRIMPDPGFKEAFYRAIKNIISEDVADNLSDLFQGKPE